MKALLIDVVNVILNRDENQNYVVCVEVLELLELVLKEGVPIYAVSMVSKEKWESIEQNFPILKSLFQDVVFPTGSIEDAGNRVAAIKNFLKLQSIAERNSLYVFDSSVLTEGGATNFYNTFFESSKVSPISFDRQKVNKWWLKVQLIAENVMYRSARSTETSLNFNERELCGLLVHYIALAMCRRFLECDYEDLIELFPEKTRSHKWKQDIQYDGLRGAMMTTEGITAFEIVVSCLEKFDLVARFTGRFYELLENAHDIPEIVRTRREVSREQFAWAVEAFLDYEIQGSWSCTEEYRENFPERMVKISTKLIDGFLINGLIEAKDGKFVWSEKMDPYFAMSRRGKPVVQGSDQEELHEEEASEFFARICMLADGTVH